MDIMKKNKINYLWGFIIVFVVIVVSIVSVVIFNNKKMLLTNDEMLIENASDEGGGQVITISDCDFSGSKTFFNVTKNISFDIENCKFSNTDSRAIIVQDGAMLTIENCVFDNVRTPKHGGAIYTSNSTIDIKNSTFENCRINAVSGLIYSDGSTINIQDSSFVNCSSRQSGGAICANESNLNITGSMFEKCSSDDGSGGAIYCSSGYVNIEYVTIDGCVANSAGAISLQQTQIIMKNSVISNNIARKSDGGGIYLHSDSEAIIEDCEIIDNSAIYGGGISSGTSKLVILDSDICNNEASYSGGGLYCNNADNVEILGATQIEYNTSSRDGGGISITGGTLLIGTEENEFAGQIMGNMSAHDGGGIVAYSTTVKQRGSIGGLGIYQNSAIRYGGGVYLSGGSYELISGNLGKNYAPNGGAIFCNNASFIMRDGLIYSNTATEHNGGGLYLYNKSTGMIDGGDIESNKSNDLGGGCFIDDMKVGS